MMNLNLNKLKKVLKEAISRIGLKPVFQRLMVLPFQNVSSSIIDTDVNIDRLMSLENIIDSTKPNTSRTASHLRDLTIMKLNIKTLAYELIILEEKLSDAGLINLNKDLPSSPKLTSKICTFRDFKSNWYQHWLRELHIPIRYHRKLWEFAYILEVLEQNGLLHTGKSGIAFGCGREPLPSLMASYGVKILATDAPPDVIAGQGWMETNQHAFGMDSLRYPQIVDDEKFKQNVDFEYVDMNNIGSKYNEQFDFVYSSCALEHLGSLRKGLDFILNSLKCLKRGGLAVHTTEFDCSNSSKIDNWVTVLYTRDILEKFIEELTSMPEYEISPINFDKGDAFLDNLIDIPPYNEDGHIYKDFYNPLAPHVKLSVDGYPCTSVGIILKKVM